jgi:hypothetical protein
MRSAILVVSSLATVALGANSTYTYTFPAGFNIGQVDSSERSEYMRDFLTSEYH